MLCGAQWTYMLITSKDNQATMKKPRRSVTLSKDIVEWVKNEIEARRFKDFSHAVEYALYHLKEESEKNKK
jgi:Arc/MetJ-type ribon-helix-helix transcriptional regulator